MDPGALPLAPTARRPKKKLARALSDPASFFIATPRNRGFRPNPSQFFYSDALSFFTHVTRHIISLAWNQVKTKEHDFPAPNRSQTAASFFRATSLQFFYPRLCRMW